MTNGRHQRSVLNVNLTRQHHYQYMGLWILITGFLIVVVNVMLVFIVKQRMADYMDLGSGTSAFSGTSRMGANHFCGGSFVRRGLSLPATRMGTG
ncbi:MAG: hypothetical protein O2923_02070 [Verrucomicrobia bacterium]|nr:hypothetical protein [Verrucomicrobiota bacterium]